MFGVFVIRWNTHRDEEFPSLQILESTTESRPPNQSITVRLEALSYGPLQTVLITLTKLPNLVKLFQLWSALFIFEMGIALSNSFRLLYY